MEADMFDLTKWDYAEVEYIPREYATSIGATYDESRPLACIGEGAGRRALDGLGLTAKQIHPYSGFEYATVSGWFRAGRNPSGATFKNGIFPALCEAYVRAHEQEPQHQDARDAYVDGGSIDEDYRLAVERKIATLVCTGSPVTREERIAEYERDREGYQRAVIRFASVYVKGRELRSLADVTLGVLNSHAARPDGDRLADIMDQTQWYWHADQGDGFEDLINEVGTESADLFAGASLHVCGAHIEKLAMDGLVEGMSDDELVGAREAVNRAMEARGLA